MNEAQNYSAEDILKTFVSDFNCQLSDGLWSFNGNPSSLNNNNIIKMLYLRWEKQGDRCLHNPYYRSVKRIWSASAFINWGMNQLLKREYWVLPVVSRKNDSGDYTEDNCQLIEKSENSKQVKITNKKIEAARELGKLTGKINGEKRNKNITLKNIETGKVINFKSQSHASRVLGKNRQYLANCISKNKTPVDINNNSYLIL